VNSDNKNGNLQRKHWIYGKGT